MPIAEAMTLQAAIGTPIPFDTSEATSGWLRLRRDGACPALRRELDGSASCTVWEARPYQCRRFQCGRPDPTTEPYEIGGPLGCYNLSDRLRTSLDFAMAHAANQRRAQPWALTHGWTRGQL